MWVKISEPIVLVKITNVCYYRGGGKGWNRKPFRVRKYQNIHWNISEEKWKTWSEERILMYLNGRMYQNGLPVWIMKNSRIKLIK